MPVTCGEVLARVPPAGAAREDVVINMKTAKAPGPTLPSALLLRADQAIEQEPNTLTAQTQRLGRVDRRGGTCSSSTALPWGPTSAGQ